MSEDSASNLARLVEQIVPTPFAAHMVDSAGSHAAYPDVLSAVEQACQHWDKRAVTANHSATLRPAAALTQILERIARRIPLYEYYGGSRAEAIHDTVADLCTSFSQPAAQIQCSYVLTGCALPEGHPAVEVAREDGQTVSIDSLQFEDVERLTLVLGQRAFQALHGGVVVVRTNVERPVVYRAAGEPNGVEPHLPEHFGRSAELCVACLRVVALFPPPQIIAGFIAVDHFLWRDMFTGWSSHGVTTRQRPNMYQFGHGPFGPSQAAGFTRWDGPSFEPQHLTSDVLDTLKQMVSGRAKSLRVGIRRLSSAMTRKDDADMLLDLVIALENALRRPKDRDVSHLSNPERLGLAAVVTLKSAGDAIDSDTAKSTYDAVSGLYKRRNQLAHGGGDVAPASEAEVQLVRRIVLASARLHHQTDVSSLVDYVVEAVLATNPDRRHDS